MNTNIACGNGITKSETSELDGIIVLLRNELSKTTEISNIISKKLDKFKQSEELDVRDDSPSPQPQGILAELYDIIEGFKSRNGSLYSSIDKFSKLVG
jgi:hypothetical protein